MRQVLVAAGHLVRNGDGQDLLEYGLLAMLIAIAATIAISSLGNTINTVLWNAIAASA